MTHKPLQRGQIWRVNKKFEVAVDKDFDFNYADRIKLIPGDKFIIDEIWVRGHNRHVHKYTIVLMNSTRGMMHHSRDIYQNCELVSE
jgi:hypothetical protein